MTIENIIRSKNIVCIINLALTVVGLHMEGAFNHIGMTKLAIGIFGLLSPIFLWNRWLYEGLFESERSRLLLSYKSFQVIGLLMVIVVFLSLTLAYDWGAHSVR